MYLLETRDLCKKFKKQQVVSKVNLKVREHTVYGLLGPNGAGKSTTLKMITGLLDRSEGEILYQGHPWCRADLKEIGALIEDAPLYSNLSARENLKVRTLTCGISNHRIDEVLKIVGLTDTGNKKAGKFSMGMKQRLGIAIALINQPKLLILDEPTNGLDPIGIQELRELIRTFPKQGITVILSSHMLSEVEHVADDIGIISGGVLGYQGLLDKSQDLEQIFMNTVREHRGEAC